MERSTERRRRHHSSDDQGRFRTALAVSVASYGIAGVSWFREYGERCIRADDIHWLVNVPIIFDWSNVG